MSSSFKKMVLWLLVVLAFALAFQYLDHQRKKMSFSITKNAEEVELKRLSGHYFWPGNINGYKIDFLVDSGASSTTISQAAAKKALTKPWDVVDTILVSTANGMVQGDVVKTNLFLDGGLQINGIRILILPDMPGTSGLLGMDVLSKVELVQRGDIMKVRFVE